MEGKRLIASIRKYHKTATIVVYDLGLTLERCCASEAMVSNYPSYFEQLHTFRWKPIVIAEALRDYGAVWYMDTSVILEKGDLRHVQALVTCKAKPRIRYIL
ncbi:hypothetical protein COOONC_10810 [Cooperia oncophora]